MPDDDKVYLQCEHVVHTSCWPGWCSKCDHVVYDVSDHVTDEKAHSDPENESSKSFFYDAPSRY
jgi:hypothetical protein